MNNERPPGKSRLERKPTAKQFAPSQKVSFAIIRGHGNADRIQFGGHPISQLEIPGAILSEQHLSQSGIVNVVNLFEPRAPLLLTSCKTGLSIGQKLNQLGFTVKAPQEDTGVQSYIVNRTNGQLQLDAVWGT